MRVETPNVVFGVGENVFVLVGECAGFEGDIDCEHAEGVLEILDSALEDLSDESGRVQRQRLRWRSTFVIREKMFFL